MEIIICSTYIKNNRKDEHPKTRRPHHAQPTEWPNTADTPLTITTHKGFIVRLDFAEKDFIESDQ